MDCEYCGQEMPKDKKCPCCAKMVEELFTNERLYVGVCWDCSGVIANLSRKEW